MNYMGQNTTDTRLEQVTLTRQLFKGILKARQTMENIAGQVRECKKIVTLTKV